MENHCCPDCVIARSLLKATKQSINERIASLPSEARNDSRIRLHRNARRGQSMIEFTFCMIVVFFMIYGISKIFQWTGVDPVQRMQAHQRLLRQGGVSPHRQKDPRFYDPVSFNAIWNQSP